MVDYKVIKGNTLSVLEAQVYNFLTQGWKLQGGVCHYDNFTDGSTFAQAMTLNYTGE